MSYFKPRSKVNNRREIEYLTKQVTKREKKQYKWVRMTKGYFLQFITRKILGKRLKLIFDIHL